MTILNLIRPDLLNSANYVPGGDNCTHRLHANELPWSPLEFESIDLNLYPDNSRLLELQKQFAARYKVDENQLVITRGSDDGIDLTSRLFLTAGQDALMQFPPTFPMYAFYVRLQQARLIQCPLDEANGFTLDLARIEQYWEEQCKIIMFCSPNNPTGNLMDLDLIAAVCQRYANKSVVVVDEAYIEFSQAKSATELVPQFENLVVLKTMSKAGGLAGLRLGSVIAQAHVIQAFNKIIAPYTISITNIELAMRALTNNSWFLSTLERIQSSRNELIKQFQKIPIIEQVLPSETNFILIKSPYAARLTPWLAKKGIAVRDFPAGSLLHQHLRITVGNERQNQELIDALNNFMSVGVNNAENTVC